MGDLEMELLENSGQRLNEIFEQTALMDDLARAQKINKELSEIVLKQSELMTRVISLTEKISERNPFHA